MGINLTFNKVLKLAAYNLTASSLKNAKKRSPMLKKQICSIIF